MPTYPLPKNAFKSQETSLLTELECSGCGKI